MKVKGSTILTPPPNVTLPQQQGCCRGKLSHSIYSFSDNKWFQYITILLVDKLLKFQIGSSFKCKKDLATIGRVSAKPAPQRPPALPSSSAPRPPLPPPEVTPAATARERYRCTVSYPASSEYELDLRQGDILVSGRRLQCALNYMVWQAAA